MGVKLIYIIFVVNMLYCENFGCEMEKELCHYNVNCYSFIEHNINDLQIHNNEDCEHENIELYNGYYYSSIRITINSIELNLLEPRVLFGDDEYMYKLIVSLEITETGLESFPELFEMTNLKKLNLSFNNLQRARLSASAELIYLENVDLSHNYIYSIEVDNSQYVYGNLRTLDLSHNGLTNFVEGTFERLKYLEYLDLSNNNIASIDHYSFEGLRNLKYLYLSQNNISDINVSLFRFVVLEELDLDNNNIQSITPHDFPKLRRLEKLNLDYNKLQSIEKDVFNDLESLSTLILSNNDIRNIDKDAFSTTNNLKTVDLSNNYLDKLPKNLFRNKPINSFSIIGNNLKGAITRGTFEGLQLITDLVLSFQSIDEIEDYAFFGLEFVTTLSLNNNEIKSVSNHSFNTLKRLKQLDLSYNMIISLDFDKADLISLEYLNLNKNYINIILLDNLSGLSRLRFLDLSHNNISKIDPNSFKSLEMLENFQLFHNPLSGTLVGNSFNGLNLIPILDLSCTSIKSLQNMSFSNMSHLQDLNISRSLIKEIDFYAFLNTGNIKSIDLSYNKLTHFYVNYNDLTKLTTLFLNNNNLVNFVFNNMSLLSKIILSNNYIANVDSESFKDQPNLNYLDLSFNNNMTFNLNAIENAQNINKLVLSDITNEINFAKISVLRIKEFEISHSNLHNVSDLHLNHIEELEILGLSHNNIQKIEVIAFQNMSSVKALDLSFNKIAYIQPGTFKETDFLLNLNLSHNSLTSLNYGIFRGLVRLNTLDVSFNSISDLGNERFYDTQNLETLIVDHNKITDIVEDFFGDQLNFLSLGDNPLSCEKIVLLKRRSRFHISALHKNESNGDNIDGIRCSMNSHIIIHPNIQPSIIESKENEKILADIRDILINLSKSNLSFKLPADHENHASDEQNVLKNILVQIEKNNIDHAENEIHMQNVTSDIVSDFSKSNAFLERILKTVEGFGALNAKKVSINNETTNKNNETVSEKNHHVAALMSDVTQLKYKLLNIETVVSEIDRKLSVNTLESSMFEKSNRSNIVVAPNSDKSLVFLEVCVSLILTIIVCVLVYKLYQEKYFLPRSSSLSTRHITDAMDNSNL